MVTVSPTHYDGTHMIAITKNNDSIEQKLSGLATYRIFGVKVELLIYQRRTKVGKKKNKCVAITAGSKRSVTSEF